MSIMSNSWWREPKGKDRGNSTNIYNDQSHMCRTVPLFRSHWRVCQIMAASLEVLYQPFNSSWLILMKEETACNLLCGAPVIWSSCTTVQARLPLFSRLHWLMTIFHQSLLWQFSVCDSFIREVWKSSSVAFLADYFSHLLPVEGS